MRIASQSSIKMEVTGYKLQTLTRFAGTARECPSKICNMQPVTVYYLFFRGKCTQIFIPTETNMEFYLRKRYRQR
jgi:hypothetical protein